MLRGGLDGLSAVVPHSDGRYHDSRRATAVTGTASLGDGFGLHPGLAPLLPFYEAGQLAPIVGVGSTVTSRSHFDQQAVLDHGIGDAGISDAGWLARHLRSVHGESVLRAMSSGSRRSLALRGAPQATPIRSLEQFGVAAIPEARAEAVHGALVASAGSGRFGQAAREAVALLDVTAGAVRDPSEGTHYADTAWARSFRDVASLIRAGIGLEAAVVDFGGWDTHAFQGNAESGPLGRLLGDLGSGLAAFLTDLGPHLETTTVAVVTEFGRRVEENASGGTDHGRAGVAFVAGGGILGGRVLGDWPGLAPDDLDDGDVRVTTDVRDVLAEIVSRRIGNPDLAGVFPGLKPRPVGFA